MLALRKRGLLKTLPGSPKHFPGITATGAIYRIYDGPAFRPCSASFGEIEPRKTAQLTLKRLVDISLGLALILAFLPLMAAIALAIKLSNPGAPVIFRQSRGGFGGRPFILYKFRTMNVLERDAVTRQATRNDDRVTALGRMLRQTSIDELPQLWNVINGDMSLIGPRPHSLTHDTQYRSLIANYDMRHNVKPGITGWAQVNGFRGETPRLELMARRIEADLWYINNWSLWLDLRIMMKTCVEVARARDAY